MANLPPLTHPVCVLYVDNAAITFYPSPRMKEDGNPDMPWVDAKELLAAYGFDGRMQGFLMTELDAVGPEFVRETQSYLGACRIVDYSIASMFMADAVRYRYLKEDVSRNKALWSAALKAQMNNPTRAEFQAFVTACKKRAGFKDHS